MEQTSGRNIVLCCDGTANATSADYTIDTAPFLRFVLEQVQPYDGVVLL